MYKKDCFKYRDILLSAGHTNVKGLDRGAVSNGYVEGYLTVEFRNLVVKHLECMGHKVHIEDDSSALRKTMIAFKNLTTTKSILVDFHWNAATPSATGTECFVPEEPTNIELMLASMLAESCSSVLNIPKRGYYKGKLGVKPESLTRHKRLGWMRLTGHNVLLEVCFLTNDGDMNAYNERKNKLAELVANNIHVASIVPDDEMDMPRKIHTVVSGDTLGELAIKYSRSVGELKKMNEITSDMIYIGQDLYV